MLIILKNFETFICLYIYINNVENTKWNDIFIRMLIKKKIKLNNFVNNYSQKVNNQFVEKFCNNQRNNTII